jgi:hypothetical protein
MGKVVQLDREFVEMLVKRRSSNNRDPLMLSFGISANTWQKIRMGEPIRASLAERLIERMMPIVETSRVEPGCHPRGERCQDQATVALSQDAEAAFRISRRMT